MIEDANEISALRSKNNQLSKSLRDHRQALKDLHATHCQDRDRYLEQIKNLQAALSSAEDRIAARDTLIELNRVQIAEMRRQNDIWKFDKARVNFVGNDD